jgi:hypothetical protein
MFTSYRPGVKQVTLRLPDVGYQNLVGLSRKYGVSFRAIFEAVTIVAFDDEGDPERRAGQLELWAVARRLEASPNFRAEPRRKIIARLDDALAAQLAAACKRFGVSQNAALGLVVMPWPEEDSEAFRRHRAANMDRIVALARALDFGRRGSS